MGEGEYCMCTQRFEPLKERKLNEVLKEVGVCRCCVPASPVIYGENKDCRLCLDYSKLGYWKPQQLSVGPKSSVKKNISHSSILWWCLVVLWKIKSRKSGTKVLICFSDLFCSFLLCKFFFSTSQCLDSDLHIIVDLFQKN